MLPVVLSPAYVRAALVGAGPLAVKRLDILRDAGFDPPVFAPTSDAVIAEAAGSALIQRTPTDAELQGLNILFVAGLPADIANPLAERARAAKILVNVEDVVPYCDFHTPGILRRGDLLFAISSGGRGPGLVRVLRKRLAELFPEEWADRMKTLGDLRDRLKAENAEPAAINRAVARQVEENGWLP